MTGAIELFDRRAVRRHRERAAQGFPRHRFLFEDAAGRLADRLDDVNRTFADMLDLGGRDGAMTEALAGRARPARIVACDLSEAMVRRAGALRVAADEEALPFAPASFDLVTSVLGLHWVNDLPGALIQIRRVLRPDGLFLGVLFGGDTLRELRAALLAAEAAGEGGASPRVSPFASVQDAGALLQRAGFALPVVDSETITVTWADAFALMRELRGMGETNALRARRKGFARRSTLDAAATRYREAHAGADGRIPATFQILFLTGWAPHEGQQRPLRPGSAAARLAEALDAEEIPAGAAAPLPAARRPGGASLASGRKRP